MEKENQKPKPKTFNESDIDLDSFKKVVAASKNRILIYTITLCICVFLHWIFYLNTIQPREIDPNNSVFLDEALSNSLEEVYNNLFALRENPEVTDRYFKHKATLFVNDMKKLLAEFKKENLILTSRSSSNNYITYNFTFYDYYTVKKVDKASFSKIIHHTSYTSNLAINFNFRDAKNKDLTQELIKKFNLPNLEDITVSDFSQIKDQFSSFIIDNIVTEKELAQLRSEIAFDIEMIEKTLKENSTLEVNLRSKIDDIFINENNKIAKLIESPITVERYASAFTRFSVSIILISIAVTMVYLIKNEATVIAKSQSLIVLTKLAGIDAENISLFDAMDRLHSYKGSSQNVKDAMDLIGNIMHKK